MSDPRSFFKVGRVFSTFWAEPRGSPSARSPTRSYDSSTSWDVFREKKFFVVVRAKQGHCLCLPIATYRGRGTLKHTEKSAQDHAIIVTFGDEPQLLIDEVQLTKQPLKVKCEDDSQGKLHPSSRINFSKVYTIEYNFKVRTYGRIATESKPLLQRYFRETVAGTTDVNDNTASQSTQRASDASITSGAAAAHTNEGVTTENGRSLDRTSPSKPPEKESLIQLEEVSSP